MANTSLHAPPTGSFNDRKIDDDSKLHRKENGPLVSGQFPLYFNIDEDDFISLKASKPQQPLTYPSNDEISKILLESFGVKLCNQDEKRPQSESSPASSSESVASSSASSASATTTKSKAKPKLSWADMAAKPMGTPKPQQHQQKQSPNSPASSSPLQSSSSNGSTSHVKQTTHSTPTTSSESASEKSQSQQSQSQEDTEPHKPETPQPDMESAMSIDVSVKPLGIILLRVMFDPSFLFNSIKNKKSELVIPHGLNNSGNICYMNSILQFLFACQPFSQLLNIISDYSVAKLMDSKTPILDSLLLLHASFKKKPTSSLSTVSNEDKVGIIDPTSFYKSIAVLPRFSHLQWGRQEDAEEFLGHLLDELHEEFIHEIGKLPTAEVTSFAEKFHDQELGKRVIRAVEFIKDETTESQFEEGGDGWKEIGINKRPTEKRTMEVKYSPIVTLFGGQFKSVLKLSNKKSSITLDPFMQVQLDIGDKEINDLDSAFKRFSKEEEISMGKTTAKKQNFMDKVPPVLIIHLKRFSFVTYELEDDEDSSFSEVVSKGQKKKNGKSSAVSTKAKKYDCRIEKIRKFISYNHIFTLPTECISNTIQEAPKYELIGVVYHHGRDTENGHYTVESKNADDEWIKIDDTSIVKISKDDAIKDKSAQSKTAYILMYKKL